MPVRILTQDQVTSLLPMSECMRLMRDAFRTLAEGGATLPLRTILRVPDNRGVFGTMPAYMNPPDALGLKAITVFHGNEGTKYDSHQGVVLLFEAKYGSLVAIMDASSVTGIRTAAASGVATDVLARPDAGDLAILGSGVQAATHLDAMMVARKLRRIRVWSRSRANAERFAREASARAGRPIEVSESAEAAVRGADLVCTVTASREPVLKGEWLAPGAHVNAAGASQPTARELDSDAVTRSRVYCDRRESVLNEAGDFLVPKGEGRFGAEHLIGEVGEVVVGKVAGRGGADEITLFKSLGIAIEDLAAAHYVNEQAAARGIGVVLEIGGIRHGREG